MRALGIIVPATSRLLTQAPELAEFVRQGRAEVPRTFRTTALPYRQADSVTHQLANPPGTHREPERLHGPVDLFARCAFLDQVPGLLGIAFEHPVTDESIAYPRYHRHLPKCLAERERRRQHVGRR